MQAVSHSVVDTLKTQPFVFVWPVRRAPATTENYTLDCETDDDDDADKVPGKSTPRLKWLQTFRILIA